LMDISFFKSNKIKRIHFIGIGGISMSGLAEILIGQGYIITGSDQKSSEITEKLKALGVHISIDQKEDNIENPDLVVFTAAIKQDNPELIRARLLNINVIERSVLLGHIMEEFPFSIAISGTHGKTSTTSMIASIMLQAELDPTIHIGGRLELIDGSVKTGNSDYFITEACEYVESFLTLYPYMAVILNIELDHIDYFKDINHVKEAFYKFASQIKPSGFIVACIDDANVVAVLDMLSCKKITYGINNKTAEWNARGIEFNEKGCPAFILTKKGIDIAIIKLSVPGLHNVSNSIAAAAAAYTIGCSISSIQEGLSAFIGAKRRFEKKGSFNGIKVIDDYAHHPTEVKATLRAAKNKSISKVWCVFQPHTYSRTKSFLNEFAASFSDADKVILTDIYAAREPNTGDIDSSMLEEKINTYGKKAIYMPDFNKIVSFLRENAAPGDTIITMGAGDVSSIADMLLK